MLGSASLRSKLREGTAAGPRPVVMPPLPLPDKAHDVDAGCVQLITTGTRGWHSRGRLGVGAPAGSAMMWMVPGSALLRYAVDVARQAGVDGNVPP